MATNSAANPPPSTTSTTSTPKTLQNNPIKLPRIAITYCTQCKWLLRAAYYGQELLSTFSTSIGEIALIPSTGGTFTVTVTSLPQAQASDPTGSGEGEMSETLVWDRRVEGGFPETKILKQKVRDLIEPAKGLGHSDTPSLKAKKEVGEQEEMNAVVGKEKTTDEQGECEDCK